MFRIVERSSHCLLVLLLAAQSSGVAALRQSAPIPVLSQDRPERTSPSEQLQALVDAGDDGWFSEEIAQQIDSRMREFGARCAETAADSWTEGLADGSFRGPPLELFEARRVRGGPIEVDRLELPAGTKQISGAQLEASVRGWLADFHTIRVAGFKLLAVEGASRESSAVGSRIRFQVVGSDERGATLQVHGYWNVDWIRAGGNWRWARLEAGPYWRVRAEQPLFRDVTADALRGQQEAVEQFRQGIDWYSATLDKALGLDIYGHNGVAIADVDGDGWEDFYVCQPAGLPNRLLRNLGNGRFEDISRRSGADLLDLSSSALFFDFDNDGDQDLLVVGLALTLLENDGAAGFQPLSRSRSGLDAADQQKTILTAAAVADYDSDGDLDIFAASYAWKTGEPGFRYPTPYHDATNGSPNVLLRNEGDGRFTDVTHSSGLDSGNDRFSLAASWADYDSDGDPDLYVANDFGRNNLYRNDGAGRFEDVAAAAGVEDLGAGMSVSWADYDNDGLLDLYVGNMFSSAGQRVATQSRFRPDSDETVRSGFRRHAKGNTLFRNRGDGTFEDVTAGADVALGQWAWSSQFADVDGDGWQDIVIANGYITNENSKDL